MKFLNFVSTCFSVPWIDKYVTTFLAGLALTAVCLWLFQTIFVLFWARKVSNLHVRTYLIVSLFIGTLYLCSPHSTDTFSSSTLRDTWEPPVIDFLSIIRTTDLVTGNSVQIFLGFIWITDLVTYISGYLLVFIIRVESRNFGCLWYACARTLTNYSVDLPRNGSVGFSCLSAGVIERNQPVTKAKFWLLLTTPPTLL